MLRYSARLGLLAPCAHPSAEEKKPVVVLIDREAVIKKAKVKGDRVGALEW